MEKKKKEKFKKQINQSNWAITLTDFWQFWLIFYQNGFVLQISSKRGPVYRQTDHTSQSSLNLTKLDQSPKSCQSSANFCNKYDLGPSMWYGIGPGFPSTLATYFRNSVDSWRIKMINMDKRYKFWWEHNYCLVLLRSELHISCSWLK